MLLNDGADSLPRLRRPFVAERPVARGTSRSGRRTVAAFTGLTRQTLFERALYGTGTGRPIYRREEGIAVPSDWSRDGSHVLLTVTTPAGESLAQFSPNGRWVVFTPNESGRDEVDIQSFPDAAARRVVSAGGGGYARWAKDGTVLYYRSLDGRLMALPARLNSSTIAFDAPRVRMSMLEPPAALLYPYDVAADGRILALAPVSDDADRPSLTVLVNWRATLPR